MADLGFGVGASGVSTAGAVRVPVIQAEAVIRALIRAVCESERRRVFGDADRVLMPRARVPGTPSEVIPPALRKGSAASGFPEGLF